MNGIEEAIEDIKKGKILIVVDDEDRENEGDFITAAANVTPETINFMSKYGRGLICLPLSEDRADELGFDLMVEDNSALHETPFTVSIDYLKDTTTGISAHDRAKTVQAVIDPDTKPEDFGRPGHIFPLRAKEGGVLRRAGHTEAVVDIARLAGFFPAGILCEIMDEDGSMARIPRLFEIAKEFDLKIITIESLIEYRRRYEKHVKKVTEVDFPLALGHFRLHLYQSDIDNQNHLAIVRGDINRDDEVLVRVHSECLTGDVFHSKRCDCGDQMINALRMIENEKKGVLLYMRQEGRGIGLVNKILAYQLQDEGRDTVEANEELGFAADLRDYGVGAQILYDLGVRKMKLITNNPRKIVGLEGYGIEVIDRIPIEILPNENNERYLTTKRDKLGHLILTH